MGNKQPKTIVVEQIITKHVTKEVLESAELDLIIMVANTDFDARGATHKAFKQVDLYYSKYVPIVTRYNSFLELLGRTGEKICTKPYMLDQYENQASDSNRDYYEKDFHRAVRNYVQLLTHRLTTSMKNGTTISDCERKIADMKLQYEKKVLAEHAEPPKYDATAQMNGCAPEYDAVKL